MLTVCAVNWGNKYPTKYVTILEAMVKKNLTIPHRFVCLTDKPEKYTCETIELPKGLHGWWNKLYLFKKGLFDDKVLYLDLDIVITGNIDEIAKKTGFMAIDDWHYNSFNSSVMILGDNPEVWDEFLTKINRITNKYHGDQDWITEKIPLRRHFPAEWILSYRKSCQGGVPKDCKIVCFHGEPKPHNAPSKWVKELWQI